MRALGQNVLRFSNREVLGNIAGVIEAVKESLPASRMNSPFPLFPKEGVARSAGGVFLSLRAKRGNLPIMRRDCFVVLRHKRAITEGSPLQDSSQRRLTVFGRPNFTGRKSSAITL